MRDAAFWELESGISEAPRCVRDEVASLRRWKSTNAPRLEALEGLLRAAQADAKAGREAIATLASERAANATLTDEVDRLNAERLDLALIVYRLMRRVVAARSGKGSKAGDDDLLARTQDFLSRNGLQARPLRDDTGV